MIFDLWRPCRQMYIENSKNIRLEDVDKVCDPDIDPENRQPHAGVFSGCVGSVNVTYLGETIDVRAIEDLIFEVYEFDYIGYPTWQEFQGRFRNTWNRYFGVLAQNLLNVPEFELQSDSETYTEKWDGSGGSEYNGHEAGNAEQKYSNTPNQYLTDNQAGNYKGLTDITQGSGTSFNDGTTSYNNQHDITRQITRAHNKFKEWLMLSEQNRNIIGEFVEKFEPLFMNTYTFTVKGV